MAKMEEYHPRTAASKDELKTLADCIPFSGEEGQLSSWESNFVISLWSNKEENLCLLLSNTQRKHLTKIWEKLYDLGLVV